MSRVPAWFFAALACVLLLSERAGAQSDAGKDEIIKSYGLSSFGDLKYPLDFQHFDYVNPDAPKGGEISTLDYSGYQSFDTLNAFYYLGDYASGLEFRPEVRSLLFDSLMQRAKDTPDDMYGLVASSVEYPPDRSWVIFNLRSEARFHDGTPVTAGDVAFSIEILKEKGSPRFRFPLTDVEKSEVLGPHRVKFTFRKDANSRTLPLFIAELPIFSKAYYTKHAFDETTLEPPMGSGPYTIADVKQGRSITYQRDPDYWGKNLPVNRGTLNFDRISFEYFRDRNIALEAFKAGVYSFREEFTSKSWATEYTGPAFDKGILKREEMPDYEPAPIYGLFINTRRDKFKDIRVREALDYAFDFEWTNKNLFYGAYTRNQSIFDNTEMAHHGKPSPAELKLLEPWRGMIPDAAFEGPYQSPKTDAGGNNRANLRKASQLLAAAGYKQANGVLVGPDGRPFEIEFLSEDPTSTRILTPYVESLKLLGVRATIRPVDSSEYQSRVKRFEFDMVFQAYGGSPTPGPDLRDLWGSKVADLPGTYNLAGVKSPAVDALIEDIVGANDRESLDIACRALDRVIMLGHYMVPAWYRSIHPIAYQDKFSRPKIAPKFSLGVLETWWVDPAKKRLLDQLQGK